jgi:hypothetical protein
MRNLVISPKELSILGVIAMKPKVDPDIIEKEIGQIELGTDATIVANIMIQQMRKVPVAADRKYINLANAIRAWAEAMRNMKNRREYYG